MAFVLRPTAELTVTFLDETGSTGTVSIPIANNATITATEVNELVTLLVAFTLGSIVSVAHTVGYFEGAPNTAEQDSRVERKGVFNLVDAAGRNISLQVPTIEDSILNNEGAIIQANTEVAPFITWLIANARTQGGTAPTQVRGAYELYRRSTKTLLPRNKKA